MSGLFLYAIKHQIGLGGPDVVPYRMAQMKNSYPFFHKLTGKLLSGMAIQEPDYTFKKTRKQVITISFLIFTILHMII